jgi:hypothetical protein
MGRIRTLCSLIKNYKKYVFGKTYYDGEDLKSKFEIVLDHLYYVIKFGELEQFYFTYGFDRKCMTRKRMITEYITPYYKFQRQINYLNYHNPRYDKQHERLTGRVITGDKFYFNVFLERFNIPTPKVYCFIKDKLPLLINSSFEIDRSKSGRDQLSEFLSYDMDAFAKPSDGQLGNGIFSLKIMQNKISIDGKETSKDEVLNLLLSADYLIQERITQHPQISLLNSSTINSIRLQTVMDKDGNVHSFGAGLRIGRKGSSVDNWAKGGVFVGIDMDKGKLKEIGFLKPQYGTSVKEHPDTKIVFKDYVIPYYKEAEELAVKLHKYMYRCHSVGWDIAITENGPVFIEGNGLWEISLLQAVHGGLKNIEKYFDYKNY